MEDENIMLLSQNKNWRFLVKNIMVNKKESEQYSKIFLLIENSFFFQWRSCMQKMIDVKEGRYRDFFKLKIFRAGIANVPEISKIFAISFTEKLLVHLKGFYKNFVCLFVFC